MTHLEIAVTIALGLFMIACIYVISIANSDHVTIGVMAALFFAAGAFGYWLSKRRIL